MRFALTSSILSVASLAILFVFSPNTHEDTNSPALSHDGFFTRRPEYSGAYQNGDGECPDPDSIPEVQALKEAIEDCNGTVPEVFCGDCNGNCGMYEIDDDTICINPNGGCDIETTLIHEFYHAFDSECVYDNKPVEEYSCGERILLEVKAEFCSGGCESAIDCCKYAGRATECDDARVLETISYCHDLINADGFPECGPNETPEPFQDCEDSNENGICDAFDCSNTPENDIDADGICDWFDFDQDPLSDCWDDNHDGICDAVQGICLRPRDPDDVDGDGIRCMDWRKDLPQSGALAVCRE